MQLTQTKRLANEWLIDTQVPAYDVKRHVNNSYRYLVQKVRTRVVARSGYVKNLPSHASFYYKASLEVFEGPRSSGNCPKHIGHTKNCGLDNMAEPYLPKIFSRIALQSTTGISGYVAGHSDAAIHFSESVARLKEALRMVELEKHKILLGVGVHLLIPENIFKGCCQLYNINKKALKSACRKPSVSFKTQDPNDVLFNTIYYASELNDVYSTNK